MGSFVCDKCGSVDNTALTRYWLRDWTDLDEPLGGKALCSACDPAIDRWHGMFPRRQYDPAHDRPMNRDAAEVQ